MNSLADVLWSGGGVLIAVAVLLLPRRDLPKARWKNISWKPFWKQRDLYRRPGYEVFLLGLLCVAIGAFLKLIS